tara:strand:- start:808 stop:1206 length:399 start_codon:yes stop_codon:yes gene_type:complete
MVKPVYLEDLTTCQIHEIPEKIPKTIGRERTCDITTSPDFDFVSRLQAEIMNRPGVGVTMVRKSEKCSVSYGPEDNPTENELDYGKGTEIPMRSYIAFGGRYILRLLPYDDDQVSRLRNAMSSQTTLIKRGD